jgi:hypothetical protein
MAVIAALEHQPGSLAHLQRKLRRDRAVGPTTDAICSKILARHAPSARHKLALRIALSGGGQRIQRQIS